MVSIHFLYWSQKYAVAQFSSWLQMALDFAGESKLYHSFWDNQVTLHMHLKPHVAEGYMTCRSHCPEPSALHEYCLYSTEHIYNVMLMFDKEHFQQSLAEVFEIFSL